MSRPWDEFYKFVHFETYASKEEILVLMNEDYLQEQPPPCVHLQASVAIAIAAYERKARLKSFWDVGLNVVGLS